LTQLDLSYNNLTELPEFLGQLTNLTTLNLGSTNLSELPEFLGQLTNLTTLNLGSTNLSELPESLGQLTNLTSLDIGSNELSELPEFLGQLTNLSQLNLRDNNLSELPESLGQLTNLTMLYLEDNNLSELPEFLGNLTNLTNLDLSYNKLGELPSFIYDLTSLNGLTLGYKPSMSFLSRISSYLVRQFQKNKSPKRVVRHSLVPNPSAQESADYSKVGGFKTWNYLSTVSTVSTARQKSSGRVLTPASTNHIKHLSPKLLQLENLEELYLYGLSLQTPPPEVTDMNERGRANLTKVRSYFEQLDRDGIDYLHEAKVLIVGEGGAGKTTLAKKLDDPDYKLCEENSTQGIEVIQVEPTIEGQAYQLNLWDFGGQEIYHATHQFFLTKRSLYLLVADERKENTDFYYWLNVIELLSDNSPVLIIKNKKKGREREINEAALRGRFSNLVEVLSTDLSSNEGLTEIWREVNHQVVGLPHIGTHLPKSWVRVRKRLETDRRDHITHNQFEQICEAEGLSNAYFKETLSDYLHDLGVCLHFKDNPYLADMVILRPTWGTDAVYRVLDDDGVRAQYGRFGHDDLSRIWHEPLYRQKQIQLLELMKEFQLCYEMPNQTHHYIAPQLLKEAQPEYDWQDEQNLILRYTYDFMPKGIITRFIVAVHHAIARQDWVWKSGVILEREQTRAEVIEYYTQSPKITVRVQGANKRGLLEIIMHELEQIHNSFPRLRYDKWVPCHCETCRDNPEPYSYPFNDLKDFVINQQWQIQCRRKPYHMVDVLGLIDGVIDRQKILTQFEEAHGFEKQHITFIENYYKEQTMSETNITDSTGVSVGSGSAVGSSGSGHAAGRDQMIEQSMAPAQQELVTALLTWQTQVAAKIDALADTDSEEKADMKAEVEAAVEEIKSELEKEEEARPSWIARRLNNIANMGDDVVEVTVTTLTNPFAGAKLIMEKVRGKIKLKREAEEESEA
ncbi:COR domain-containing protein, partial [Anaerolineales bacterium HSG24]|nr:COR domain-containing protein [Anaerolineales bacterium HSG24]